jgi:hypothetical protein
MYVVVYINVYINTFSRLTSGNAIHSDLRQNGSKVSEAPFSVSRKSSQMPSLPDPLGKAQVMVILTLDAWRTLYKNYKKNSKTRKVPPSFKREKGLLYR